MSSSRKVLRIIRTFILALQEVALNSGLSLRINGSAGRIGWIYASDSMAQTHRNTHK